MPLPLSLCLKAVLCFLFVFATASASAQETRALMGQVSLDVGVASRGLPIDVTVNNHSFAVLPPAFTIIRPITSSRTTRIMIEKDASTSDYLVEGILTDAVDYTVEFRCAACSDIVPTQYYSPSGNFFGFANPVFLDPDELGPVLDVSLISRARVAGKISMQSGAAKRDLNFELIAASANEPSLIYRRRTDLVLGQGQQSIDYEIAGLRRNIGSDNYLVSLRCTNCFGRSARAQTFDDTLSPMQNHTDIDFLVTDETSAMIAPMVDLLLNQNE